MFLWGQLLLAHPIHFTLYIFSIVSSFYVLQETHWVSPSIHLGLSLEKYSPLNQGNPLKYKKDFSWYLSFWVGFYNNLQPLNMMKKHIETLQNIWLGGDLKGFFALSHPTWKFTWFNFSTWFPSVSTIQDSFAQCQVPASTCLLPRALDAELKVQVQLGSERGATWFSPS